MKKIIVTVNSASGIKAAALIDRAETTFEDYLQAVCFHYHLTRQSIEA